MNARTLAMIGKKVRPKEHIKITLEGAGDWVVRDVIEEDGKEELYLSAGEDGWDFSAGCDGWGIIVDPEDWELA